MQHLYKLISVDYLHAVYQSKIVPYSCDMKFVVNVYYIVDYILYFSNKNVLGTKKIYFIRLFQHGSI